MYLLDVHLLDTLANVSCVVGEVQVGTLMCGSVSFSKRWSISRRVSLATPGGSQSDSSNTPLVEPPLDDVRPDSIDGNEQLLRLN